LAHAEAIIDFGDDEDLSASSSVYEEEEEQEEDNKNDPKLSDKAQSSVWGNVQQSVSQLRMAMERHTQDNQRGEIIRQGVRVAIIGPVNAGKSSLLNILAKRDAAIVSPIAGTTRDIVEVIMDLGGVRCIVSDTAGIRDTVRRCTPFLFLILPRLRFLLVLQFIL
jgi:tRNA modification GTPase